MSKTEEQLEIAVKRKNLLMEKKDRLSRELLQINNKISDLQKRASREKIAQGITKIEVSGFTIDDLLILIAEKQAMKDKEGEI